MATKLPGAGSRTTPLSTSTPQELALNLLLEMEGIPHPTDHSKSLIETWGNTGSVIKLLIDQGLAVEIGKRRQNNPLIVATRNKAIDAVKVLVGNGVNVDSEDYNCRTALSYACEEGYEDVVRHLIQKNANIEKPDWHSKSPWMYVGPKQEAI